MTFVDRLSEASTANQSLLCIGLDPQPSLMPFADVFQFNKAIIDATHDLVCAYKPNLAFYEALGLEGLEALKRTVDYIHEAAKPAIVIGDAKRGDVGDTAVAYAKALFEYWQLDAATVNAFGGSDTLEPFFAYPDRGVLVWCRSSNPGAREFQDLELARDGDRMPLFKWIAQSATHWGGKGTVGLVAGATYLEDLQEIRALCPDLPILIPGIGAQGGELEQAATLGSDTAGRNAIISSSRQVLYASKDRAKFAEASRGVAQELRRRINAALEKEGKGW